MKPDADLTTFITPVSAAGFGAQIISRIQERYLVRATPGEFTTIALEGMTETDGFIALKAPPMNLRPLTEVEPHDGLFHRFIGAVNTLNANGFVSTPCTDLLYLDEDDALLTFSTELGAALFSLVPENRLIVSALPYGSFPGTTPPAGRFEAAVAYRLLTGEAPFPAILPGENPVPPCIRPVVLLRPRISEEIASWIDGALAGNGDASIPQIDGRGESLDGDVSDEAVASRSELARTAWERCMKQRSRETFFRRHGRTILYSVVGAALILALPINIIRHALEKPGTVGMEPQEVVMEFYAAWDDLDQERMDDTVARRVAEDRIRQVSSAFVVGRVQEAYGGTANMISAGEWFEAGKPAGRIPYGPANVAVQSVTHDESTATVEVTYTLVTSDPSETETLIRYEEIEETVSLESRGDYWEITALEMTLLSEQIERFDPNTE